jgi:hypothetical protein
VRAFGDGGVAPLIVLNDLFAFRRGLFSRKRLHITARGWLNRAVFLALDAVKRRERMTTAPATDIEMTTTDDQTSVRIVV